MIGLDIGGTKIEMQVFAPDWQRLRTVRVATPGDYPALLDVLAGLAEAAPPGPVGISAAGALDRATGRLTAANLAADGQRFPADLAARLGRPVRFVNDARALALSEAHLGAGQGARRVLALVLGTGVGGAFVQDGAVQGGAAGLLGEVGHMALAAGPVLRHGLPVLPCGCGRTGCAETLLSGPGLARLAQVLTGQALDARAIAAARQDDPGAARVWSVWCELVAETLLAAVLALDPDVIVLGGGLSRIEGIAADVGAALAAAQLRGFAAPAIRLAEGGDASGARGAALAAALAGPGDLVRPA